MQRRLIPAFRLMNWSRWMCGYRRFIACLSVVVGLIAPSGACAAIWEWGCQGQLGGQQLIFNRYSAVVLDSNKNMGDIRKLFMDKIKIPPGLGSVSYEPQDVNVGLVDTIVFARSDDPKQTLTLTEKSSKKDFRPFTARLRA
jgi:hypothetical protein